MTKDEALAACRNLDLENATVSLWTIKKGHTGEFKAKSIEITDALVEELKRIVTASIQARTEADDYTLTAQCNEVSCLHVGTDETCFSDLREIIDRPAEEHRVSGDRDLLNVLGYVIRLRSDQKVLYCVKKVTDSWKTKKARSVINVVMRANQLDLVEDKSFTISKSLDFVVLEDNLFIINKRAFETLLTYKAGYENSFSDLQREVRFTARFSDLEPLISHVGTNVMHLRRMAVVHEKAHYADDAYMARLREVNAAQGWNIQFDDAGRIVPTEESMKAIMQVLLNHRLYSQLSLRTFDVPSSSAVQ